MNTFASASDIAALYSELLDRRAVVRPDPSDDGGFLIVCEDTEIAHVQSDGEAHAIAGLNVLLDIAAAAKGRAA